MTAPPAFTPQQVTDAIVSGLRRGSRNADLPPADAARQAALYRHNLARCQQHVRKSLAEGDYLQAAEKSWGAYAQTIKAISADRRFTVSHHGAVIGVAARLALLAGASDPASGRALSGALAYARSLHQHFYENDLPDETVIASSDAVATAIDLMHELFATMPGAQG